ncbi:MAG: NUDIX domain-containing protein [Nitrospirales bacterium]
MPQTPALAAVIEERGALLLCRRPPHKRHGGLWEFPGGKIQDGESLLGAAQRELFEAFGVEAVSVGPIRLSVKDPSSDFLIQFVEVEIRGEPKARGHSAIAWVRVPDLLALPLAPSDRTFAEMLGRQERL